MEEGNKPPLNVPRRDKSRSQARVKKLEIMDSDRRGREGILSSIPSLSTEKEKGEISDYAAC